ncbi:serpin A3-8-like [Phacochoerus africanus]|uniref:serpin A3-8-like n=1 Tax=Phacochoerus africanus TaxID=41426 RepID=UPI001FD9878D|nr:serpin A3-8-like [Phacochoerus africanus]
MRAEGMSLFLALGLLVAGLCSRVHCVPADDLASKIVTLKDEITKLPAPNTAVVSSNTDFAFSLYKQLVSLNPSKNVIFSPLSVSMALAFLSLGARGPTLTELLEGLKFNLTETLEAEIHQGFQHLLQALSQPSNLLQLNVGNAMFVDEHLKLLDEFRRDAQAMFASDVFSTNFKVPRAAVVFINDYVKNKTKGKIPKLFDEHDSLSVMVLVNYVYFKAKWKTPFDPEHTIKSTFYVSKNRTVEVPMMSLRGLETPYFRDEELACTVVELPYTSNDSALFILPDHGRMVDVEAKLLPETLKRWRDSLHPRRIDALYLPRFSVSGDYQLEDILKQLGIQKVFTHEADLSGVTGDQKLGVSRVIHKAVLDVGEEGTEAAAATGIAMLTSTLHSLTVSFSSPFLFAVIHKDTGTVLFLGKVTDPSPA